MVRLSEVAGGLAPTAALIGGACSSAKRARWATLVATGAEGAGLAAARAAQPGGGGGVCEVTGGGR